MKVLVTGAAGFVGREVWKQLKQTKYEIYGTDIRKTDEIEYMDITQFDQILNYLKAKGFGKEDAIINLAAKVAGKPSFQDPWGYFYVNVIGTLNILEAMRVLGMKYLVYISSWSTYGSKIDLPITEDTPQNPENPYGASKKACEVILQSYSLLGIQAIILRPTMIYGSGQEEENVLQQVVNSMVERKTLELYGKGTHTREFLNVKDAARIMIQGLEVVKKIPTYEVFILGTEHPITISALANKARKISKFPIVFKPSSAWAFSQRSDMAKLKKWFDIDTKDFVTIEDGLKETLEYRRKKK